MGFFEKRKKEYNPKKRNRKNGFGDDNRTELTSVTCDSCGKSCKVPFRPTAGKPVYCNDCFRKTDPAPRGEKSSYSRDRRGSDSRSGGSSRDNSSSKDFAKINAKLDRIIDMLEDKVNY